MSSGEINVKVSCFDDYCNNVQSALNRASADVADLCANIESVHTTIPVVNSMLGKMKTESFPKIEVIESAMSNNELLAETFKEKSIKILYTLQYYKEQLAIYDGFDGIPSFDEYFKNLSEQDKIDFIGRVIDSPVSNGYSALSFMMGYTVSSLSAEALEDLGMRTGIPAGFRAIFKKVIISPVVAAHIPPIFTNPSTGAVLTGLVKIVLEVANDPGDLTNLDIARYGLDGLNMAATTAEWLYLVNTLGVSSPLAAIVCMGTGWVLGKIKDVFLGDNCIDEFTRTDAFGNERKYKVSPNGEKEGTWDVLYEQFSNKMYLGYIDGVPYSSTNYYKIFDDWQGLLQNTPIKDDINHNSDYNEMYFPVVDEILNYSLTHFDNAADAEAFFENGDYWDHMEEILEQAGLSRDDYNYEALCSSMDLSTHIQEIFFQLEHNYGFDYATYYNVKKGTNNYDL